MKRLCLVLAAILLVCSPAVAKSKKDRNLDAALKRLDPSTRQEQVCDLEAMRRIGRENKIYRPDRSVIGAVSELKVKGDIIEGEGGAFRSKGAWYRFSFTCKTSEDRLRVLSFQYEIGDEIPEAQWQQHGLYQ